MRHLVILLPIFVIIFSFFISDIYSTMAVIDEGFRIYSCISWLCIFRLPMALLYISFQCHSSKLVDPVHPLYSAMRLIFQTSRPSTPCLPLVSAGPLTRFFHQCIPYGFQELGFQDLLMLLISVPGWSRVPSTPRILPAAAPSQFNNRFFIRLLPW